MGETPDEVRTALTRSARRGLRHRHHHAVPAAVGAPPPRRALGQARGVRRARGSSRRVSGFAGVLAGPLVRSSYRAGGCMRRQRRVTASRTHPYPDPMAKTTRSRCSQGRKGRGEGHPQGGFQAAPQPAVAGVPDPAQGGQAPPALHDRRVRADRGGLGGRRACSPAASPVFTLIPLGVVLGALVAFIIFGRRAQKSVYQQGRGPDRCGGVGAGQPARQVAGHPGCRGHRPLRRGAPGDRQARRDLRRRRVADAGQTAAGAGEEAHRAAGRRRPDLRRRDRQRRGRGAAGQAGTPPDQAARQHHRQADGLAGVAAGRARLARSARPRCRRARCPTQAKMRGVQRTVRRR